MTVKHRFAMNKYKDIRHTARYRIAKDLIAKALKTDNVKSVYTATGEKARLIVHRRIGKDLTFRGEISLPLIRFIHKKRYCKDEMPKIIYPKY